MTRFDESTATIIRPPGKGAPLGVIVRVLHAQATPANYRLQLGRCVIGSGPASDIVIADPAVSRQHCELSLVAEGVALADMGSKNGIFYLGQRVERAVLSPGAMVSVGNATVMIDADSTLLDGIAPLEVDHFDELVGVSLEMRRLFAVMERLKGSLVPVLIEGESGVGKELVARALHRTSQRAAGPLIAVNCGAIPRELVASELFGHRRGAFTGAADSRKGAFESAHGGTLFLDEIGELPLDVQPMLLRALESGEVRAVGSDEVRHVQVRLVAATNRDLEEEVQAGRFREDVFYRLGVVRVRIPPLRERPADIEPIARRLAAAAGITVLDAGVIEQLKGRSWQGNVRELRNVIQAFAALGALPKAMRPKSLANLDVALGEGLDMARPYAEQKDELSERFTRVYLAALMAHTAGNQTAAAKLAGLDRSYLGKLLAKHGIKT